MEEAPAPQRLAPFAYAMTAAVVHDEDEIATGRLILLHDPVGHDAWEGTLRQLFIVKISRRNEPCE